MAHDKTLTQVIVPAAPSVRVFPSNYPRENTRAQGRPGARRTHGPRATKKHAAEPQVRAGTTGLPCAMVYGLYVVSPVNQALLPPSPCRSSPAKLSASVGAPGPHDFAVRTDIVRLTLPIRPSHPALAFVTTRTPLVEAGRPRVSGQSNEKGSAIFFKPRLDDPNQLEIVAQNLGFYAFDFADRKVSADASEVQKSSDSPVGQGQIAEARRPRCHRRVRACTSRRATSLMFLCIATGNEPALCRKCGSSPPSREL
jgi:hypothetical protein